MKVLINTCYGGFGLSKEAEMMYKIKANLDVNKQIFAWDIDRWDTNLIATFEELGPVGFSGGYAEVELCEVNEPFIIGEYDGTEWIQTLTDFMSEAKDPNKITLRTLNEFN